VDAESPVFVVLFLQLGLFCLFAGLLCLMFAFQLSNVGMLVLVMERIHSCIVLAQGRECGSQSRALLGARDFS
jgi:hypothetical protein